MAATWRIDTTTGGRDEALDDDVWFQQPPGAGVLAEVITIAGEDGEPLAGEVLVRIVSVTPPVPAGVTLEVFPPGRTGSARLMLITNDARILGNQNPRILELGVLTERGGPVTDVKSFDRITSAHAEVVSYMADPSHRPAYTMVVEVTDWAANSGPRLAVERRTYVFGLRKDYTPNRDALATAVNARR
jgi:hypothetical protein